MPIIKDQKGMSDKQQAAVFVPAGSKKTAENVFFFGWLQNMLFRFFS